MFFASISSIQCIQHLSLESISSQQHYWMMTCFFDAYHHLLLRILLLSYVSAMGGVHEQQSNDEQWQAKFYFYASIDSLNGDETVVELPSFLELNSATRHYREMADGILKRLALSHEVALRTEEILMSKSQSSSTKSLSHHLEKKISKSAELLEHNAFVLEEILKPFPVEGIPIIESPSIKLHNTFPSQAAETFTDVEHTLARYIPPYYGTNKKDDVNEEQPYEEAVQIIAHLTRDWSKDGSVIRDQTFGWIKQTLWRHHYESAAPLSPILIPGAGTGRLAFDLAFAYDEKCTSDCIQFPFSVEGMDNSVTMAAAANHMFHILTKNDTNSNGKLKIYPFVSDSHTNEVDTQRRWDSTTIPEESVLKQLHIIHKQSPHQRPKLSYTVGDFVTTYSLPSKREAYGSLVTLFFIDTATNIYEYIFTIHHLLRNGGVWINYGPVQWHRNSQLHPTTNELRDLIQLCGFKILFWEISEELVAYRHPDDDLGSSRSTRSEAYRPLKFVAAKSDPSSKNHKDDCLSSIEEVRLRTGRRSIVNLNHDD